MLSEPPVTPGTTSLLKDTDMHDTDMKNCTAKLPPLKGNTITITKTKIKSKNQVH